MMSKTKILIQSDGLGSHPELVNSFVPHQDLDHEAIVWLTQRVTLSGKNAMFHCQMFGTHSQFLLWQTSQILKCGKDHLVNQQESNLDMRPLWSLTDVVLDAITNGSEVS